MLVTQEELESLIKLVATKALRWDLEDRDSFEDMSGLIKETFIEMCLEEWKNEQARILINQTHS